MNGYDYTNQDTWCGSENTRQNPYTNDSYDFECYNNCSYNDGFYDSGYYNDDPYEPCDNGWGWTDDSVQNHYYESPYSSETQESLDESSDNNKWDQMRDMQEDNSKRLLNIQKKLEELMEQLNQPPPPGNLSDTTQVEEVSFLCHDEFLDKKVHEPTPTEVDMVVEDYVSFDDKDTEGIIESKEVVIESEKSQIALYEPVTPKVGEGFVEDNTTPDPTDLKAHEKQLLFVINPKFQFVSNNQLSLLIVLYWQLYIPKIIVGAVLLMCYLKTKK